MLMARYANEFHLSGELPEIAYLSGLCHDVGKMLLPPVMGKERDYRMHPVIGAELLYQCKDILFVNDDQAHAVYETVRCHHEQPDGKGFPFGCQYIPLTAGICAIADELDNDLFIKEENLSSAQSDIKDQGEGRFGKCAVLCFENAWPGLNDFYTKWI
jgi:HD-GYP domain-containing protein (c-di-GMP phosphodiesterase class II)